MERGNRARWTCWSTWISPFSHHKGGFIQANDLASQRCYDHLGHTRCSFVTVKYTKRDNGLFISLTYEGVGCGGWVKPPATRPQGTRKGYPYHGRPPPSLPWNFASEENGCDFVTVVTVRNGEARGFGTFAT